jgi:hypothetical protein
MHTGLGFLLSFSSCFRVSGSASLTLAIDGFSNDVWALLAMEDEFFLFGTRA